MSAERMHDLLEALGTPQPSSASPTARPLPVHIVSRDAPAGLPAYIQAKMEERPGNNRSSQTWSLAAVCLEWGLDDSTTAQVLANHAPTVEKAGGNLEAEIARVLGKLRPDHPHPAYRCIEVGCPCTPDWMLTDEAPPSADRAASTWLPMDLGPVLSGTAMKVKPTVLRLDAGQGALLYPGKFHTLVGEPEALKTWLVDIATLQEIQSGEAVLWIDYEDNEHTITDRLNCLGLSAPEIEASLLYVHRPEGTFSSAASLVESYLSIRKPSLIVIDSMNELMHAHGLSPNETRDVIAIHDVLRRLAKHGAAVVTLDHVVKASDNRGRWPIGSERKLSGLDGAGYRLVRKQRFRPGSTGVSTIEQVKDRPGGAPDAGELTLISDQSDGSVTYSLRPAAPTSASKLDDLKERISDALGQGPLNKTAILGAVSGRNTDIEKALNQLIDDDYVRAEKIGRSIIHSNLKSFPPPPAAPVP